MYWPAAPAGHVNIGEEVRGRVKNAYDCCQLLDKFNKFVIERYQFITEVVPTCTTNSYVFIKKKRMMNLRYLRG